MCWRSSPDRERPMVRLKRSTAGLNICAGLLWGSVTSPTTSPGVCSSPVASDRFYTLNYDEPHNALPPGGSGAERPPTYVLLSGRGIRAHLRSREFQSDQRLRESDGRGHSIDDRDSATIDDRLFEIRHSPAPEDDDFSTVTLNRLGGRVRNGFNGAPGMALEIKNRHS